MYDSLFCRVYNEFGWNEYPRAFGEALLEWLRQRGISPRTALDLGCGTGALCETLREQGMETLGIDLSADMIAVARRRSPGLDYRVGDMTDFEPPHPFDLVTCTGDALNHVTDPAGIERVFVHVWAALGPGGLFVFDLLREEEVPPSEPFEADFSDRLRVRFTVNREPDHMITLQIEGFEGDEPKFIERIRERIYDISEILGMLRGAGFEILQCTDHLLTGQDAHGTTWFVIAQKIQDEGNCSGRPNKLKFIGETGGREQGSS